MLVNCYDNGLFKRIYDQAAVPSQWLVSKTIPIYKNKTYNNYHCQAHLLADILTIPLMYSVILWNNFLKKKKVLQCHIKKSSLFVPLLKIYFGTPVFALGISSNTKSLKFGLIDLSWSFKISKFFKPFFLFLQICFSSKRKNIIVVVVVVNTSLFLVK